MNSKVRTAYKLTVVQKMITLISITLLSLYATADLSNENVSAAVMKQTADSEDTGIATSTPAEANRSLDSTLIQPQIVNSTICYRTENLF